MDKLVERESAPRNPLVAAPALAVQFFLIPLAVVGVTVMTIMVTMIMPLVFLVLCHLEAGYSGGIRKAGGCEGQPACQYQRDRSEQ